MYQILLKIKKDKKGNNKFLKFICSRLHFNFIQTKKENLIIFNKILIHIVIMKKNLEIHKQNRNKEYNLKDKKIKRKK